MTREMCSRFRIKTDVFHINFENFQDSVQYINRFSLSAAFNIETSHLFCWAKQMTGSYMKCYTGLKWVNLIFLFILWTIHNCLSKTAMNFSMLTNVFPLFHGEFLQEKRLQAFFSYHFQLAQIMVMDAWVLNVFTTLLKISESNIGKFYWNIWEIILSQTSIKSSCLEVLCRKPVLKSFAKFLE